MINYGAALAVTDTHDSACRIHVLRPVRAGDLPDRNRSGWSARRVEAFALCFTVNVALTASIREAAFAMSQDLTQTILPAGLTTDLACSQCGAGTYQTGTG